MKSSKYLLAAGALLALVASPALAYEAGTWVLRAGVGVVAPDSDNLVLDPDTIVNVDDGTSLTLMGTYMFSPNWAFDVLASWPFNHDIKLGGVKIAETDHLPPTFSLQYHFLPDSNFQPYAGAGVNYTTFFSTDITQTLTDLTGITNIDLDDSFGLALQLGADGFLLRSASSATVLDALRKMADGRHYIQPELAITLLGLSVPSSEQVTERLTSRQLQTLQLLARGMGNRQISREVEVSETTVKAELRFIYAELGASNRVEAAATALRIGLVN